MSVERTVIIEHRPSSQRGTYGITITPLDQGFDNPIEIASSRELATLLRDLEYSQSEANSVLKQLELAGANLKHNRSFDQQKLKAHGFTLKSMREYLDENQ